ncbi:carbohydrate sulfotransferase 14-like [Diadema antillarum]|uniref:carbohydrate sulfotransferase 14-like n=1 Tax=Diadema antillarum TaxID=105358 RepID=UPI003A844FC4
MGDGTDKWRLLLLTWLKSKDPSSPEKDKLKYRNFSFTEFVQFYTSSSEKNAHWREINEMCSPCLMHYDFIGLFETLREDAAFLVDALNETAPSTGGLLHKQRVTNSSQEKSLRKSYSRLPRELLQTLIQDPGIVTDLALFGYDVPRVIQELLHH